MSKDEELRLVKLVEKLAGQNATLASSLKTTQEEVKQLRSDVAALKAWVVG